MWTGGAILSHVQRPGHHGNRREGKVWKHRNRWTDGWEHKEVVFYQVHFLFEIESKVS